MMVKETVNRFLPVRFILICSSLFFAATPVAQAQWVSDSTKNTPVCTASGIQQNPKACADGADGVIITWEDFRSNHWDVYAQKLDREGIPQWTKDGVLLCNTTTAKNLPIIASDGNGGAYVVWKDQRRGGGMIDLYAQHIKSDGSFAYGSKGIAVDSVPNAVASATSPNNPVICSDGSGNAYVMWEDNRSSISSNSRPDIYGNFLTPNNASWGKSGAPIIANSGFQTTPRIVADGFGGCYLAWVNSGLPSAIFLTRINGSGSVLWNNGNGIGVYAGAKGTSDASRNPVITRDGSQVLIAWETKNSTNSSKGWNVLAQRFKSDGTRAWGSGSSAFEISTDYLGDQTNPTIFSDDSFMISSGFAGVMVVFQSNVYKNYIVMTRGWGDGINYTPAVPNQMFLVCNQLDASGNAADQIDPVAVKAGNGQVLAAWIDYRLSGSSPIASIYAQRVDKTPRRFLGPSPASSSWGVPVSNRGASSADELMLVPRTNGAIAVWRDNRNGSNNQDIYAQVIFIDGTLPIELSSFGLRSVSDNSVLVEWQTASEINTAGFEIERRSLRDGSADGAFEVVGSYTSDRRLSAAGNSSVTKSYSYLDRPAAAGSYEYRLVDYTLDGARTVHDAKRIEVGGGEATGPYSVGSVTPNPCSTRAQLELNLPTSSNVTVRVLDVLGRMVAEPYENTPLQSGDHRLEINTDHLPGSGSYYLSVIVSDAASGSVLWTSEKATLLQVIR